MITPMVALLVRDPFDREGWLFELKWDGFRTIAETDGTDGVKLYSRNQRLDNYTTTSQNAAILDE